MHGMAIYASSCLRAISTSISPKPLEFRGKGLLGEDAEQASGQQYHSKEQTIYAFPLAAKQYIQGAALPDARLLGPNNINKTYTN